MLDLIENIRNTALPIEKDNSNILSKYLDIMEKSIEAYDFNDIESKLKFPIHDFQNIFQGYSRIGMSRLLNVMAVLIHNNCINGKYDFWVSLLKTVFIDITDKVDKSGVEFLILELCSTLIYGRNFMKDEDYSECINYLIEINPYEKYDSTLKRKKPEDLHNFCMYGICAEYLRGYLTGINTEEFIISHWKVQKNKFDEEGRYMDPDCPMVYDITSRYRLAFMLYMGYSGAVVKEMKDVLMMGAPGLLYQISSDFKFPYGGRSNQFNFNESLVASMCEFYADEFYKLGDIKVAGAFSHCAVKSMEGLDRWLKILPARHIKNLFPIDSNYGIDSYGTYERYMGTMGTFLTGAVNFHNEKICPFTTPTQTGGYVYETGENFHKLFASCGGYSMELEKNADNKHDATGLGRIHFSGAPIEIALSMPFASHPKYLLGDYSNNKGRALGAFWFIDGEKEYLAEMVCAVTMTILNEVREEIEFSVKYLVDGRGAITENYTISKMGISIKAECDFAEISYCVPILHFNGESKSVVILQKDSCEVHLGSWVYKTCWEEELETEFCDYKLYNRNGEYRELNIKSNRKRIAINLSIKGAGNE